MLGYGGYLSIKITQLQRVTSLVGLPPPAPPNCNDHWNLPVNFCQRMQKRQERRLRAAENAQDLYIQALGSSPVQPMTYKALVKQIGDRKSKVPWDPASRALFAFFVLLVVGQAAFVLWGAKIIEIP